jgi:nucleoside-diphosphate-sugar epimerase
MGILVVGGAGFIGSHLCANLARRGHRTSALDAFRSDAWPAHDEAFATTLAFRSKLLADTNVIRADVLDTDNLLMLFERLQPATVVHLAGQAIVSTVTRNPAKGLADILQSTVNVLDAVRRTASVKRFVFVSSSMVYGHFEHDDIDEEAPTRPVSFYGSLKLAGEVLTRTSLAGSGIEHVIARPMGVYGPGEVQRRVIQVFCEDGLAGVPVTLNAEPGNRIDFTHVDDLVDGLVRCCTDPRARDETFNLAFGKARTLDAALEIVRASIPNIVVNTTIAPDTAAPRRGTLGIEKARRLLRFDPQIDLEVGVERYIRHLKTARGDMRGDVGFAAETARQVAYG